LYVITAGDLVEGDHDNSFQLFSKDPRVMIDIAVSALSAPRAIADEFFVVRGTPRHVGQSGWQEEIIGKELDATMNGDEYSFPHLKMITDSDVYFDVAHFGRVGKQPHTISNTLNQLVVTTMFKAMRRGVRAPDVIVRAHTHRYATSGDNYDIEAYSTPSWKLVDEYTRNRIDPDALSDIGLLVFECQSGEWTHEWIGRREYEPIARLPWRRSENHRGSVTHSFTSGESRA
jgi:hypothetical protein